MSIALEKGLVSAEDVTLAHKFLGTKQHLSISQFVLAKQGSRPDLANDASFLATDRVMEAIGLNQIPLSKLTAEPYELQFWQNVDEIYELQEKQLREDLPKFILDPSNQVKAQALLEGRTQDLLDVEQTKKLSA